MTARVVRFADGSDLAQYVARRLLERLLELQSRQADVNVCLTGGRIANQVYETFAALPECKDLDASNLSFWWSDERFVPTDSAERNSLQTFALLARTLTLSPSNVHVMPASDGKADADEAAFAYAQDLGDTVFDLNLLGVGADGHVASIFPNHPSNEPTTLMAIGVADSPKAPSERISLTIAALNRSRAIWLIAKGSEKSDAVARSVAGDSALPASRVAGLDETIWFVDEAAASGLPYFECDL